MELFIRPTLNHVRKDIGFEEWEDVNDFDLLFQQGFDGEILEVEDGETFTIPEDYIGGIVDDDKSYYWEVEIHEGVFEKEEIFEDLKAGQYRLKGDIIEEVSDLPDFMEETIY